MLGAPDVRVVLEACLHKLENGYPVFFAVDVYDVDWSVVDGHPVHADQGFHVQSSRLIREYPDVVKCVSLVSRTRYERLVGTGDRVHSVRPSGVLDCGDIRRIPLIVDVLPRLCTEVCPVNRKCDRRDQDDSEYHETLDSGDLDVQYSLGPCVAGHERYPDQHNNYRGENEGRAYVKDPGSTAQHCVDNR